MRQRSAAFLSRRPHRSFRKTSRRDYARSLKLPGYIALSGEVLSSLLRHKKLFIKLLIFLVVLFVVLDSVNSLQQSYQMYVSAADETDKISEESTNPFMRAGLIAGGMLSSSLTGGFEANNELRQVLLGFVLLMGWLITVWLLRSITSGQSSQLRDGLYNAGAPIIGTFMVYVMLFFQLLPFLLAVLVLTSLEQSGLLTEGFGTMLTSLMLISAGTLTLYWVVSTFFALIIVTLPGMRPWQAMRAASDIVVGRRIRLVLRLLWLAIGAGVGWFLVVSASVLFDAWLTGIWPAFQQIRFVTIVILVLNNVVMIVAAAYIYILYRKVVDDEAASA